MKARTIISASIARERGAHRLWWLAARTMHRLHLAKPTALQQKTDFWRRAMRSAAAARAEAAAREARLGSPPDIILTLP